MTVNELSLSVLVATAIMSILLASRHVRAEEESGRTALLLSTGLDRVRWALGWLAVVVVESLLALLPAGAALGAGVTATTGDLRRTGELALAALAYAPAVLVVAGIAAARVGLVPRFAALNWAVVACVVFVSWFGLLLDLPEAAMHLSPVQPTPLVPSEDWDAPPLLGLTALGLALLAAAAAGFRRRDLVA